MLFYGLYYVFLPALFGWWDLTSGTYCCTSYVQNTPVLYSSSSSFVVTSTRSVFIFCSLYQATKSAASSFTHITRRPPQDCWFSVQPSTKNCKNVTMYYPISCCQWKISISKNNLICWETTPDFLIFGLSPQFRCISICYILGVAFFSLELRQ